MNKEEFRLLSPNLKAELIRSLSKQEQKAILSNPDLFLFPKQVIEGTNRYILLRCGRRFGKSYAGGAWIAKRIYNGDAHLGLCGPTYNDIYNIMVPSIQRWFYGIDRPVYNNLRKMLVFSPKSRFANVEINCFTSDKEIRGYSLQALWCDEVGAWLGNNEEKKQRFYSVDTCVSEGNKPQTIITTTPKAIPLFFEWKKAIDAGDTRFKLITGTMFDNPFLSDDYRKAEIAKYGNTRFGRQEIFGDLLEEFEGALFTREAIDKNIDETKGKKDCDVILIAVDPAVSSNSESDETGIIVLGLTPDNKALVLDDLSGRYAPNEWADKVSSAFDDYGASFIIAERNQGGDLIKANMVASNRRLEPFIKLVLARKGKLLRAEPVSNLLEKGRILFSRQFPELFKQMVEYVGQSGDSPDRMDAFVYGATELLLTNQDLNVFKPLSRSSNLPSVPMQELVYCLGIDIKPTGTHIVLSAYNSKPQFDNHFYILHSVSSPMSLMAAAQYIRGIMEIHKPILITATKPYAQELRKFQIPAKDRDDDPSILEAFNSDIENNRIKICNNLFDPINRLLRGFQYDGEILEKSGSFVLLQEDGFLNALMNSFSRSKHFLHKIAINREPVSFEQKLLSQIKAKNRMIAGDDDDI